MTTFNYGLPTFQDFHKSEATKSAPVQEATLIDFTSVTMTATVSQLPPVAPAFVGTFASPPLIASPVPPFNIAPVSSQYQGVPGASTAAYPGSTPLIFTPALDNHLSVSGAPSPSFVPSPSVPHANLNSSLPSSFKPHSSTTSSDLPFETFSELSQPASSSSFNSKSYTLATPSLSYDPFANSAAVDRRRCKRCVEWYRPPESYGPCHYHWGKYYMYYSFHVYLVSPYFSTKFIPSFAEFCS